MCASKCLVAKKQTLSEHYRAKASNIYSQTGRAGEQLDQNIYVTYTTYITCLTQQQLIKRKIAGAH